MSNFQYLKRWNYLEALKLDINGENAPQLEINEVVLVYCNIANNEYQHDSRVLDKFVPMTWFGQLLDISTKFIYIFKNL